MKQFMYNFFGLSKFTKCVSGQKSRVNEKIVWFVKFEVKSQKQSNSTQLKKNIIFDSLVGHTELDKNRDLLKSW